MISYGKLHTAEEGFFCGNKIFAYSADFCKSEITKNMKIRTSLISKKAIAILEVVVFERKLIFDKVWVHYGTHTSPSRTQKCLNKYEFSLMLRNNTFLLSINETPYLYCLTKYGFPLILWRKVLLKLTSKSFFF